MVPLTGTYASCTVALYVSQVAVCQGDGLGWLHLGRQSHTYPALPSAVLPAALAIDIPTTLCRLYVLLAKLQLQRGKNRLSTLTEGMWTSSPVS